MRSDELTSFRYGAPVNSPIPDLWEPRSAGEDLSEALSTLLAHFSRTSNDATAVLIHREAEDHGYDSALFFTIDPGHVHVVGLSPLDAQVRRLLGDGFNGWHLYTLPPTRTPLHTVRGRLASRFYNVLERNGFASLEEIAVVPPAGWREINHVGARFLEALDAVMPATIDRAASSVKWVVSQMEGTLRTAARRPNPGSAAAIPLLRRAPGSITHSRPGPSTHRGSPQCRTAASARSHRSTPAQYRRARRSTHPVQQHTSHGPLGLTRFDGQGW